MSWSYSASVLTSAGGTSGSPDLISAGLAVALAGGASAYTNGLVGWISGVEIRINAGSWVKLDDDYELECRGSAFINPNGGFEMGYRCTVVFTNTTVSRIDTDCDFSTGSSFVTRREKVNDPSPKIVHRGTMRVDFPNIQVGSVPALVNINGLDIYNWATLAPSSYKCYWDLATSHTTANLRIFCINTGMGIFQAFATTYTGLYVESLDLSSDWSPNTVTLQAPRFYMSTPGPFSASIRQAKFLIRNPTFLNACWNQQVSLPGTDVDPLSEIDVVYTFQQTFKHVLAVLPGVNVQFSRAVTSSTGSPAWSPPASATLTATADSNGTFTAIDLLDTYHLGTGLTTVERYAWTCKARGYDYATPRETVFSSRVMYQPTVNLAAGYSESVQLLAVAALTLTSAQAAALTGISLVNVNPVAPAIDTAYGTVTVTADHTVAELWAYYRWWISQATNFDAQDSWSFDGVSLGVGKWNVVVTGATLTGGIVTAGSRSGSGAIQGQVTRGWWPP